MKDERLVEMRIFRAVAETGGFTAAALMLDLQQPYVSRAVSTLEKRLGVALLRRSTRRLQVTQEGHQYLALCKRILDEIDVAEAQLSRAGQHMTGGIRVTVATSFGMDQIVPLIPGFLERYPGLRVRLSLSDTLADVIGEGFDVAIRMGSLQDSNLVSRKLCHLQRVVTASPSYIARHGVPLTPADLAHHNCLMWEPPMDHLNHWPFVIDGERTTILINGNFQTSSGVSSVYMCLAGVGITRMAEHMVLPSIRSNMLVPLLTDFQPSDETAIYALYPRDSSLHPRVRAFIDYIGEKLERPPWAA
ncbi:LysR family transcriptional regulator [Caballeronia sp. GAFFF1]|uniref:LysR family transcriptional regulator n=1 Tax=Caballeronia sp. GAFFF1 TaxID=2921779 RepID=UPI00202899AB|nr:LysR family transcriptional regulator [Caballeronia sp. GAFFF1]